MKKYFGILFALLWIGVVGCNGHDPNPQPQPQPIIPPQQEKPVVIDGYGDLYVIRNTNKTVRVVAAKANGNVFDTLMATLPKDLTLRYHSVENGTNVNFEFELRPLIEHQWRLSQPEKTLVVSDLHGQLAAFVAVLQGSGVIDKDLKWTFGKNQLLVLGDILDRGREDNGIAWLVYKLEQEAKDAGGHLDFIIGNHEDLVMKSDLRYVNQAHLDFAVKAKISYSQLYGSDSELGRWFRDRYLMLAMGNNVFVHAGLSPKLVQGGYKPDEINQLGRLYVGYPNDDRNKLNPRNELLFDGTNGIIWYRGMVKTDSAISSQDLETVLAYYSASRIFVGHTEVSQVQWRYGGRVVAENVAHDTNFPEDYTAGVLITPDGVYSVTYSGKQVLLGK